MRTLSCAEQFRAMFAQLTWREILGRRHAALSRTQAELLAALNLAGVKVKIGQMAERLLADAMLREAPTPPACH